MISSMRAFLILPTLVLVSSACAPFESRIAMAVALTLTAQPAATPLPLQPLFPGPSSTPEYPQTDSRDYQVIDVNPHEMLLTLEGLSPLPKYYLPEFDSVRHHRNIDVLQGWGKMEGLEYINRTGRIDGWIATYFRGDDSIAAPEWIEDTVVLYATSAGASSALNEYGDCDSNNPSNPIPLGDNLIGDEGVSCMFLAKAPDGQEEIWYYVDFRYRNFYHSVAGHGLRKDIPSGYLEAISYGLLSKLIGAPLSEYVTYYYEEVFPL